MGISLNKCIFDYIILYMYMWYVTVCASRSFFCGFESTTIPKMVLSFHRQAFSEALEGTKENDIISEVHLCI
jgi:hypothetical protein